MKQLFARTRLCAFLSTVAWLAVLVVSGCGDEHDEKPKPWSATERSHLEQSLYNTFARILPQASRPNSPLPEEMFSDPQRRAIRTLSSCLAQKLAEQFTYSELMKSAKADPDVAAQAITPCLLRSCSAEFDAAAAMFDLPLPKPATAASQDCRA